MCRNSSEPDDHILDVSYVLPRDLKKRQYHVESEPLDYIEWMPVPERVKWINLQTPLIFPAHPDNAGESNPANLYPMPIREDSTLQVRKMVLGDLIHQLYLQETSLPHFTCVDVHGMLDVLFWAQRITFGTGAALPPKYLELQSKLLPGYESMAIKASKRCVKKGYCPNRLWNVPYQGLNAIMDIPQVTDIALRHPTPGDRSKHLRCTDSFCVYSHDNSTQTLQAHKCGYDCKQELSFPPSVLDAAFSQRPTPNGTPTQDRALHTWHQAAWAIDDHGLNRHIISPVEAYMAISHVWSDGTGGGMKRSGYVNHCLFAYFADFAKRLGCKGIWWDAISIPTNRDARRTAMNTMLANYENASVTLVHDEELANFEWRDDGSPAVALVLSSWFTRGWTAAELYASRTHPVKVVFKCPRTGRPLLKDLDNDVLALECQGNVSQSVEASDSTTGENFSSQGHLIASEILRQLRRSNGAQSRESSSIDGTSMSDLRTLLHIVRSRITSWHRDRMIIPGLMCLPSIHFDTSAHSTQITQELMTQFGRINITDLFHSEVPLARFGPWSWCPPSIFDFGQSPGASLDNNAASCRIENGRLVGNFEAVLIRKHDVLVPYGSHPATLNHTRAALSNRSECFLLADPSRTDALSLCILAKPVSIIMRGASHVISCRWLGCVYLTRKRSKISSGEQKLRSLREKERDHTMFEFGSDAYQNGHPMPGFSSKLLYLASEAFMNAKWEGERYTWYLTRVDRIIRRDYPFEDDQAPLTHQLNYASPICIYPTYSPQATTQADEYVTMVDVAYFPDTFGKRNVENATPKTNTITSTFLASLPKSTQKELKPFPPHGKTCLGTVTLQWSFPYPRPSRHRMKRRLFDTTFHVIRRANASEPSLVIGARTMKSQIEPFVMTDQASRAHQRYIHSSYLEELEDQCAQLIVTDRETLGAFDESYNTEHSFDTILSMRDNRRAAVGEGEGENGGRLGRLRTHWRNAFG
ncbi:MAG: hypothetical protein Q9160_008749 [Pyrenula sp. 1 TL-2023]